jgi:hypothetical protein
MPQYRLSVVDPATAAIVAAVTVNTHPCDQNGHAVQGASQPPPGGGWLAHWGLAGGQGMAHAPVYYKLNSLVFPDENLAYQAARKGVDSHYRGTLQQNVRVDDVP